MDTVIREDIVAKVEIVLQNFIDESGATYALITDMGGNPLFSAGEEDFDVDTLAALSAANYATTKEIANLIKEDNFSLLFHRGNNENVHFAKITPDVLMIVLFKPFLSLGLLRLKINGLQDQITALIES
ncbi:Roadblock/LC7 family protein [Desulfamplus magnetovallimortis]|uniref:Roadblock/LC7 family protein n=1 Tax=Desulfamplus magnetovallimortis TaxID=1246637 RepID=A0A1W1HCK9_9BACT|nr:roadblock/LC7 domain-containing protein [Desulfamplus magnetovallimortis]SLM30189.1 Roadblock/LC7 family protein [Desulfamplus magnetovallimortis]